MAMTAWCVWALDAAAVEAAPPAAAPAPVPGIEDFFRLPALTDPVLSPDGHFLAASVDNANGRLQLVVVDLHSPGHPKVIAGYAHADVIGYHWVNDERLVYSVTDTQQADRPLAPGLWAINRDGSGQRELIDHVWKAGSTGTLVIDRALDWDWALGRTLRDGSADVIVIAGIYDDTWEPTGSKLARVDTVTGHVTPLTVGAPPHVVDWSVDDQGQINFAFARSHGHYTTYRHSGADWKVFEETDDVTGWRLSPRALGPDGQWWIEARRGTDVTALFTGYPDSGKLADQPTVSTPGYDFDGDLVIDRATRQLLGVHYETDAEGSFWLDPDMKALQTRIDKMLPATINRIDCEQCRNQADVLVTASADRQPPIYYVYNRPAGKLTQMAASRPWIQPRQMGQRDVLRFKSRDGLAVPVLVTHPPGPARGPRPTVVLVHGGPWIRGTHWAWEPMAQFLASRGYLVVEPEFRGSEGYGFSLFQAGWKQWGQAMQDDVTDATRWAVQQGWADAQRICIAGASYGGYATLMGLIREPALYQCGFEWVGVTDIGLMYSIHWSDSSTESKRYDLPTLVGDPVAYAQQLKETSPIEQAARLTRPLLMAYGGQDYRVPIDHGTALRDAVSRTNHDIEWVVYPHEGHGWEELEDNVDFWGRVERFLDHHIGAQRPEVAASAPATSSSAH
jgi:dipeptidyl aminopeptidase/acylaminoacyl peptidase